MTAPRPLRPGDRVRLLAIRGDGAPPAERVGQVVTVREVRARRTGEVLFVLVEADDGWSDWLARRACRFVEGK